MSNTTTRARLVASAAAMVVAAGAAQAQEVRFLIEEPGSSEAAAVLADVPSYAGAFAQRSTLTGDWGGARDRLAARGFTLDVTGTGFWQGVVNGGADETSEAGGRVDAYLNVDGEKAGLWQGLFLTVHAEYKGGNDINAAAGTLFPVNFALAVPTDSDSVFALTAVTVTQFLSENWLVYFGKLNTVDDSNQPYTGGGMGLYGFNNGSLLQSPILARTVPYATLGGGVVYLRDFKPIASINVYDTNNTPTTTGFDSFFDNGATLLAQVNLPTNFFGMPGHQGVSVIYSTGDFLSTSGVWEFVNSALVGELIPLREKDGSWGVLYQFDQALWVDPANPETSFGLFGNFGVTDGDPNPIDFAGSIGIGGSVPFASRRGLDTFGVGYFYTAISDDLIGLPGQLALRDEQGIEAFYNIGLTPWFEITANAQYVRPAFAAVDNVTVLGLRALVTF